MEITVPAVTKPSERRGGGGGCSANIIKVIVCMLLRRRKPGTGKTPSVPFLVAVDGKWQRFVGSMRPMHVQVDQSPPVGDGISRDVSCEMLLEDTATLFVDLMRTTPVSLLSTGYNSPAVNVDQELGLCKPEQTLAVEEMENECGIDDGGDEMIDAKAEEFIAKFYEQMRLQC